MLARYFEGPVPSLSWMDLARTGSFAFCKNLNWGVSDAFHCLYWFLLHGYIDALSDKYTGSDVQVDGKVITANGPKSAMAFALEICKNLGVTPKF